MVATTASSFKSCVIIQIILYVVAIVEMITNYLSITTYNQVAAIGFISAIPFLRRRHAECCIKKLRPSVLSWVARTSRSTTSNWW